MMPCCEGQGRGNNLQTSCSLEFEDAAGRCYHAGQLVLW